MCWLTIARRVETGGAAGDEVVLLSPSGDGMNEIARTRTAILLARSFHKLQVHVSVISELERRESTFAYNLAAVYPIKHGWFPTFEFNGRHRETSAFYLTPGLYHKLRRRSEIGIGIPLGVRGTPNSLGVVLKTNWEFGGDH